MHARVEAFHYGCSTDVRRVPPGRKGVRTKGALIPWQGWSSAASSSRKTNMVSASPSAGTALCWCNPSGQVRRGRGWVGSCCPTAPTERVTVSGWEDREGLGRAGLGRQLAALHLLTGQVMGAAPDAS